MDNSLSWFASENPEQIQKLYNIINHKSVNDFYLFHNTISTSSEILSFLIDNNINSNFYKNFEVILTNEFPHINFSTNNIVAFMLLYYISQNNVSKIIVNIPTNIPFIVEYGIIIFFKDIRFFYPNLITELYISEKIDENYDDTVNYTTNIFCRNIETYEYYVNIKSSSSSLSKQNKYKYFPKLFYIKFSNTDEGANSNSKLITNKYKKGITFGTFDLFHFGHDNILKRCMQFCEYLCIGLSSDELNVKKGKNSIDDYEKRKEVIEKAKLGDEIFKEESLEYKDDYVLQKGAEILMMGDDWVGKFDWVSCDILYMERTPNISTTILKEQLKNK
jgi:glycerol-3-phosphate cytidylyltransferase